MSEQRNRGEYHRADPAHRRKMQAFLALTAIGGILALVALHFWLRSSLGAAARHGGLFGYERFGWLLAGLCLLLGMAAAGFALWIHRIAMASKSERRWPPSSMRTSGDIRIRYLTSADSLVAQMRATAIVLGALALILTGWAVWLLWSG